MIIVVIIRCIRYVTFSIVIIFIIYTYIYIYIYSYVCIYIYRERDVFTAAQALPWGEPPAPMSLYSVHSTIMYINHTAYILI